jgi:hypothetical protein
MATIVTHTTPKTGRCLCLLKQATIETTPDMPTIAVSNPSRQLPAATMHSAGASMGGKSKIADGHGIRLRPGRLDR